MGFGITMILMIWLRPLFLFLFLCPLFLSGKSAWGNVYANAPYSPLSIKIRMQKEVFKVGEPIVGTIVLQNIYSVGFSAIFDIKLFHENVLVSQLTTAIKRVPFGTTEFSFQGFGIPPFNDNSATQGNWRISIVQQNLDASYAKEVAIHIIPSSPLQPVSLLIPGAEEGVGFDDLIFSFNLRKVLLPAGRTGKLFLIDPDTYAITSIGGFSSSSQYHSGHGQGITSVDEGQGFIFTADRGTRNLEVISARAGTARVTALLAGDPDYVRYVEDNHEVWVTEPHNEQIEVFAFSTVDKPVISHKMFVPVPGGPESLVIDYTRQRAYTHLWKETTVAIDLNTHAIAARWPNGCVKSRGIALDAQKGFLFVGCGEGKAVVINLNQDGQRMSSLSTGPGVDMISYNPGLSHLYLTGSKDATLSVVGVSSRGELSLLGVGKAVEGAHCVAGDDCNNIWVCDPQHGQLLRYKDVFAAVK